ncbi:MAG: amidohydrolase family protein [Acidobacteria bacterium]|nr:amidohydrolase family protein [Acidobacteriota bacterium]
MLRLIAAAIAASGQTGQSETTALARSGVLAIVNATVIPMTGERVLSNQTVVASRGRISAVGPSANTPVPKGAVRIDGTGKYLIPGVCDAHVHFQQDETANRTSLQLFLANGITTVLNLYGTPMHLELRSAVARGELAGPAIVTSGPTVGTPHGQTPTATPEEIAREVIAQKRSGYDVVKLHGDLSSGAYRRLMTASAKESLPVVGHAPRNLGVAPMLELRQQVVAHAEEYLYGYFYYGSQIQGVIPQLDHRIQTLATDTAKSGTAVISTVYVYRGIADQITELERVLNRREVAYLPYAVGTSFGWWAPNNTYFSRFSKRDVPIFRYNYRVLERLLLAFQKAGVRLLAGTDTPTSAVVPGFSIHDELRDLVNAGFTPFQALQCATVNPAIVLGYAHDRGTIEPGKRADLVLLGGNPLENVASTALIDGVMRNGRWLSATQIKTTLERLAKLNSPFNQRGRRR